MEVGCGERNYNPFIGGPIPHFDGWDECYRRIWDYDSCKPKPIKNKFNIGDEVWAITGHRVVDFKIGKIILNDGRIFYGPSDFMFMDSSDKEGIEEKYLFKSKEELIKTL